MSLNTTPASERIHIGFFGMRNAGKSSLVNAVTNQELSVVSPVAGTTTDPVKKAMELLPLGPVVIIDTPGIDDEGSLGELRIKKTRQVLSEIHLAVLVTDAVRGLSKADEELTELFKEKKIPYVIAYNKTDLLEEQEISLLPEGLSVSARTGENVDALKERLAMLGSGVKSEKKLVADLLEPGDLVVLVVPIDESAPKGRLILPQQQTIRDVLEAGAVCVVVKDTGLEDALSKMNQKPKLVITDSQVFGKVSKAVPENVMLTSFSILFARYKGNLKLAVQGAAVLDTLSDGDKILISEGCTHHRQCGDIGSVKIPAWIRKHTQKNIELSFTSGGEFPEDLSEYRLVIHCGGCTLTEKAMQERLHQCKTSGVPVTNYGIAIAHMHGILRRSLEPFPEILRELDGE